MVQRDIDVNREVKPRAHADPQQIEIRAHEVELTAERRALAAELRQRRTQITHQADDRFRTGLWPSSVETAHVAQYVEQKMRLDLRLEQRQLLFGHVLSQLHTRHLGSARSRIDL